MAKKKIVWVDDACVEHATEADADRANMRIAAEAVFKNCWAACSLKPIEGVNHQTLAPLQAYVDLLVRESMERTEKYG